MTPDELKQYILGMGVSDVGFSRIEEGAPAGLPYAVTLVVRLSEAIVAEIDTAPTHTYFNHYRAVNAFIDRALLQCGLFLQQNGYRYITVAASQSINLDGWHYCGRFSHKQAAVAAGLGGIGKNSLFIHRQYGSMVRLGTLFTDCPLPLCDSPLWEPCGDCRQCADACPAHAIRGTAWHPDTAREEIFDPHACSDYMKHAFQHIGRGSVCGICMRVCPYNNLRGNEK